MCKYTLREADPVLERNIAEAEVAACDVRDSWVGRGFDPLRSPPTLRTQSLSALSQSCSSLDDREANLRRVDVTTTRMNSPTLVVVVRGHCFTSQHLSFSTPKRCTNTLLSRSVESQSCSLDDGETCDVSATATVVYAAGADDQSGGSSARGVESISRKENLQKIASSAGVEASDVRELNFIRCFSPTHACPWCSLLLHWLSSFTSPGIGSPRIPLLFLG